MHSLLSHPSLMDCRRVFLRNYEVWINIGVHAFEKRGEQRVLMNVDLYVPHGHRDPHWTLWLEVWNRSQNAPADARDRQAAIEGAWHRDLVALLAEGVSRGEFRAVDPDRVAARLRALLDGFSIHVAIGLRGADRAQILGHVREFLDENLLADA